MKKYRRGLLVGKFAPLHLGHDFVIRKGLEECEEFIILSYTNPEFNEYPPELRRSWLKELYPSAHTLVLNQQIDNLKIPENSADDDIHRDFVAKVYSDQIGKPLNVVYTSESYGDGFAARLSQNLMNWKIQDHPVCHINVDQDRKQFPVSGTQVRSAIHDNIHFLPPTVYASLVKSVCFIGAESTGKSTLTHALAKAMKTSFADEYGRTLWEQKNGKLEFSDFLQIARTQVDNENAARLTAQRFFFADTSPLTTLFYSESYCRRVDPELLKLSFRKYDYLFLCLPDFPLVQDGTRADEAFRSNQHKWYLRVLKERDLGYQVLKGSLADRIATVVNTISKSI